MSVKQHYYLLQRNVTFPCCCRDAEAPYSGWGVDWHDIAGKNRWYKLRAAEVLQRKERVNIMSRQWKGKSQLEAAGGLLVVVDAFTTQWVGVSCTKCSQSLEHVAERFSFFLSSLWTRYLHTCMLTKLTEHEKQSTFKDLNNVWHPLFAACLHCSRN